MKDITDQKQLKILNIIKKALDQENYIKIYQAECYEIHEEVQQLESEIKKLEAQYIDLDEEKVEDRQALKAQIKLKRQKLKDLRQENLFLKKIQNIREDVLEKCQNLLQRREEILQENQDIVLNFEFQLYLNNYVKFNFVKSTKRIITPELKVKFNDYQFYYASIVPHRTKFYQHHLTIITNNLIATMLFDDSISINDKVSELYKLNNMKIDRISDIPGNLISCEIQNQIKELDCIKNIMKISDETMDPQKVDFKYFLTQCRILFEPIITD